MAGVSSSLKKGATENPIDMREGDGGEMKLALDEPCRGSAAGAAVQVAAAALGATASGSWLVCGRRGSSRMLLVIHCPYTPRLYVVSNAFVPASKHLRGKMLKKRLNALFTPQP